MTAGRVGALLRYPVKSMAGVAARPGPPARGPVDVARFRPNVVLDVEGPDFPEDHWTGRELALGDEVVLALGPGMPRCVTVGLPQGDLTKDEQILRTLAQERDLPFGLGATVVHGGTVRVGDGAVVL